MHHSPGNPRPEGSIPRYRLPIVGREQDVAAVERALRESRVVTIVGAGGIGKTRLAAEVAARAEAARELAFVDLEALVDGELVATSIAAGIGAEVDGGSDPISTVVSALAGRSLLLALDNCEQVLASVARVVTTLVERTPNIAILATSREALKVTCEQVYRLEPLEEAAGVALFLASVRRRSDGTEASLTDAELPAVAQICRKLDGIPLAIELAAARVPSSTPTALLRRLSDRFQWRSSGENAARRHHETLRSLIDWSYDQLDDRDRAVFVRLGVFSGEFTLDAARYVVGEETQLQALADKSLIVPSPHGNERYRMLESLREYALLRLREVADEERIRRAHAAFFAGLAAQAAAEFGAFPEEVWRSRYEPDLDNFRAAITWAQTHEKSLAASMLGNLKEFWFHANLISEGLSRSQTMIASLPPDSDVALGPLLAVASLAWRAGENRASYDAAARALAIATRTGDARGVAAARYGAGWALFKLGDMARAVRDLGSAVDAYVALGDSFRVLLAEIDYAIALKRTDPRRGRALLEQALPIAQASGWPRPIMRIEIGLAEYAFLDGEVTNAIAIGRECLSAARASRSSYALLVALVNLTAYLALAGESEEARVFGCEAATLGRATGIRIAAEWALQGLAIGLARDGTPEIAARLLGHVDAFTREVGAEREPTEAAVRARLESLLLESLAPEVFDAEYAAGGDLTLEQAFALAVKVDETPNRSASSWSPLSS